MAQRVEIERRDDEGEDAQEEKPGHDVRWLYSPPSFLLRDPVRAEADDVQPEILPSRAEVGGAVSPYTGSCCLALWSERGYWPFAGAATAGRCSAGDAMCRLTNGGRGLKRFDGRIEVAGARFKVCKNTGLCRRGTIRGNAWSEVLDAAQKGVEDAAR